MEEFRALADSRRSRRRLEGDSDMIRTVHERVPVLHKGARHKGFGRLARGGQVQERESHGSITL
jgi:hypothetical protein